MPQIDTIAGDYVIDGYEGNKNDWHYVTIEEVEITRGEFKWTNRAGISWMLTWKDEDGKTYQVEVGN